MKRHPILAAFLLLLAVVVGAGYWLLRTESGLRWVWARAAPALEGVVAVEALQGALAGPLRLTELVVTTADATVHVPWLEIDWQPSALLWGTLRFERLLADGTLVTLSGEGGGGGEPFQPPDLPLALDIGEARIDGLDIHRAGEPLLALDVLSLSGGIRGSRLDLDHLRLEGRQLSLAVEGNAALRAGGPLDIHLAWSAMPPDGPTVSGSGAIGGSFDRPQVKQTLTAPAAVELTADLAWLDQPLTWQARLEGGPVQLSELGDLPPTEVALRLQSEGGPEDFTVTGDARIDDPQLGPWRAELAAGLRGEAWRMERLLLAEVDGPARVRGTAAGHGLSPDALAAERIDLSWEQLQWPVGAGGESWRTRSGELSAKGAPDDYGVTAEFTLAGPDVPEGSWRVAGGGDRSGFTVDSLAGRWLAGTISGTARIDWVPHPAWRAELDLDRLDPASGWPRWPGQLSGTITSRGQIDGAMAMELAVEGLKGTLRGYPVAGHARVATAGESLRVDALTLSSGSARVQANGRLGTEWALTAELAAPDLEHLHPDLAGALDADARFAGRRDAPTINVSAHGERLAVAGRGARDLTLRADLDAAAEQWQLELNATGVDAAPLPPEASLHLTSAGSPAEHAVQLTAATDDHHFELAGSGGWNGEAWHGELSDGRLVWPGAGEWRQLAPVTLAAGAERVQLSEWCWGSDPARLCAGISPDEEQAHRIALAIERLPMERLAPLLTEEVALAGELDGSVALLYGDAPQGLTARITTRDARLDYSMPEDVNGFTNAAGAGMPRSGGEVVTMAFALSADAETRGRDLLATVDLSSGTGGYVRGSAHLPEWLSAPFAPPRVVGEVELAAEQIAWLAPFLPQVSDPRGSLSGRIAVDGPLPRPQLSGRIALTDGGVVVPELGVTLEAVELALTAAGEGPMEISGTARSGPGSVDISGTATVAAPAQPDQEAWRLTLRLAGEDFEAIRLPQARVLASPDLDLVFAPGMTRVTGEVVLPEAEIGIPELPEGVQPSPDVVIVGGGADELSQPEAGPALSAEVTVRLGERVRVSGYGFEGRLEGALTIIERPGELPVGRGDVRIVDGRYAAYGQELTITDGRLLFAATPLDNPRLDFRAVRSVGEVTVGVTVTGEAREPLLRLFSSPPMEESEVLSYLILGRPLRNASSDDASLLSRAALSLGLAGGERIAQNIAGRFGLDLVEVESGNGVGEAALVLGKYLSPRLYVEYAVGLMEESAAWMVRYELTERLAVEAETGATGGVDLFYTFER